MKVITKNFYEDFDKQDSKGMWLRCWNEPTGIVNQRESHHTLSGARWDQMEKRCTHGSVQQVRAKSYEGCLNLFSDFQEFVEWSRTEYGYCLRDAGTGKMWSLDKDLLSFGKIYSPNTCVFVPNKVNIFLAYKHTKLGELPIGVYFNKSRGKYVGQIKINGKAYNLGGYSEPLEAHRAWQVAKIEAARILMDEFVDHAKLASGLASRIELIKQDYEQEKVTTC